LLSVLTQNTVTGFAVVLPRFTFRSAGDCELENRLIFDANQGVVGYVAQQVESLRSPETPT
jgi:hypothetical protein